MKAAVACENGPDDQIGEPVAIDIARRGNRNTAPLIRHRAIETETGMIPTQVTRLNDTLTKVRDGLVVVNDNLGGVIAAVSKQVVP